MSGDRYLYPDTQTLRNNYDIRDPDRLDEAERMISSAAMRQPIDPPPEMNPEGLQRIHRHIFGRIYPWAGELRTINLEKFVTAGKTVEFERGPLVRPSLHRFFAELRDDKSLCDLDAKTFAYRAAVYMEDLNFIHPFREGNGRTQRNFLECLARQAGHNLDQGKIDERAWLRGSIQSYRQPIDGAHEIMTRTIEHALTGPDQRGSDRAGNRSTEATRKNAIARGAEKIRQMEEREAENTRDPDERGR